MMTATMRALGCALMTLFAIVALPCGADTPGAATRHLAMRLVADSPTPRAGAPVTLAIDTRPDAGWHGYWANPGDAGFPAKLDWHLPDGLKVGEVRWPVPTTLVIAGLMNYVYERPYAPLVTLDVPAGLKAGTPLPVRLDIDYLVCSATLCVPERQSLALDLTVGDGAPAQSAAFDAWRAAIPRPLDARATYAADADGFRLAIPVPASAAVDKSYFFPLTPGAIDYAAPQSVNRDGDTLVVATTGKGTGGVIEGVLRIGPDRGLAIRATPGTVAAARPAGVATSALVAFAGALLGGLILNIMPCVFPILSLKALALTRSGEAEAHARGEALAYTAGVVFVCMVLGGLLLALRAGGASVGWAFQLTDPRVIVILFLLTLAIAFNLAGLFELPAPNVANRLTANGKGGAFATGALAAFVATPCTGPFMGAALGAALILPTIAALFVFAGLGLGIALPFLLLGFVPALRRVLPKPGAWMDTFRKVLAIPMFLTAVGLAWLLGRLAGVDGMAIALLLGTGFSVVLWVVGRRQARGLSSRWAAIALAAVAAAGVAIIIPVRSSPLAEARNDGHEPFTEARLAALRREGRPVFVYFTADWCLTCKVNEKAAIETSGVAAAFRRNRVAVLMGDWTDGDAVMGRFIEAHNRAGVPLYLFYPRGAAEPRVLPQVLTPAMLEALGR